VERSEPQSSPYNVWVVGQFDLDESSAVWPGSLKLALISSGTKVRYVQEMTTSYLGFILGIEIDEFD
jgi:hypothetical protein